MIIMDQTKDERIVFMKDVGIIRKIDTLGRIVIPKELRNYLNYNTSTKLEIRLRGRTLMIQEAAGQCLFCGATDNVIEHKDGCICKDCIDEIST